MRHILNAIDAVLITFVQKISMPVARGALFAVFFWFGLLKVVGVSPAVGVVTALFEQTFLTTWMTSATFLIILGIVEMLIGLFFLVPKLDRLVILVMILHMITTFLPLILLPGMVWQMAWVPTIEGQYIIKNLVLIAVAIGIAAQLRPWRG